MPNIELVDNMRKAPAQCFCCHTTPTENGKQLKAIDLGTDHDWGQWTYLCSECVTVICELWGWVPEEVHDRLKAEHQDLKDRHKRLRTRYISLRDRTKKIVAGRKAERKVA